MKDIKELSRKSIAENGVLQLQQKEDKEKLQSHQNEYRHLQEERDVQIREFNLKLDASNAMVDSYVAEMDRRTQENNDFQSRLQIEKNEAIAEMHRFRAKAEEMTAENDEAEPKIHAYEDEVDKLKMKVRRLELQRSHANERITTKSIFFASYGHRRANGNIRSAIA